VRQPGICAQQTGKPDLRQDLMAHFVQNISLKTAGECFGEARRMQTNFTAQQYQEADP
jgi:hypothetical protein